MRRAAAIALLALASACAGLPVPGPQDVQRARDRYPQATSASLAGGRRLFVSRCSGCHTLPQPSVHRPDEWPKLIDEMADQAKLDQEQRDLVEQYLVTMSARTP